MIQARNPINQALWIPLPPPASAPSELKAPEIFITPPPWGRGEGCVALGVSIPSCLVLPPPCVCAHVCMCLCLHGWVCTPDRPGASCRLAFLPPPTPHHRSSLVPWAAPSLAGILPFLKGWACRIGRLRGQVGVFMPPQITVTGGLGNNEDRKVSWGSMSKFPVGEVTWGIQLGTPCS